MDKNLNAPLITVVMAVFNGEAYIKDAIESTLNQTFTDFELLIINDGSTDHTVKIIQEFQDPRIRLLHNDGNKGLCYTRIRSVEEAWGTYLAVLDCDDIALPDRLKLQIDFMEAHPAIDLCGGQALVIDGKGNIKSEMNVIAGHKNMRTLLTFHNIFINSTLMIRLSTIKEVGGYSKVLSIAGDYDLSFKISIKHHVANLPDVLVHYRIHEENMSSVQSKELIEEECHIIKSIHRSLNMPKDEDLVKIHHKLMYYHFEAYTSQEFLRLLEALKHGNSITGNYPPEIFNKMLFNRWFMILRERREKKIISLYFKNKLFDWSFVTFKEFRKVFKQSLFCHLSIPRPKI